jgi:adenylate cyclase
MPVPDVNWEEEGLLEGVEGEGREARERLLDTLLEEGHDLEELREAVEEDRLALLPVERVLGGTPEYDRSEVAERSGLDQELLVRIWRALGLPLAEPDAKVFSDRDVDEAERLDEYLDAGVPEDDLVDLSRILGLSLSRVAEAVRSVFAEAFLSPGDTEEDLAKRYAAFAERLMPFMGPTLDYVFRVHLREIVRSDVVTRAEREAGHRRGTGDVAVAFADMADFTGLGERVESEELGSVADRLSEVANEVLEPPVRIVKTIGDAVMFVSTETGPLLDALLALLERSDEDDVLPPLKIGVAYGEAVNRHGDWYGRPVNLASRVAGKARPGSLLATEDVRELCEDGYRWSDAGRFRLKGFDDRHQLFRVRRPGEDDDGDDGGS